MKFQLLVILFLIVNTIPTLSANKPSKVPARHDSIAFCQPNGESIFIFLHGDEHKHFYTTTDGFVIKKNKKGYFCYAKQTFCGTIKHSCKVVRNIEKRSKSDKRYLKRIQKKSNLYLYSK